MSNSQQIFSRNLKILLENKKATRPELAQFVGVSTATVSDWINGKQFFSRKTIDKLCDYFCISPAQLLSESGEVKPSSYDEKTLLDSFRKLNDTNKNALLVTVQTLLNAQAALEKTESA